MIQEGVHEQFLVCALGKWRKKLGSFCWVTQKPFMLATAETTWNTELDNNNFEETSNRADGSG
jgi:hypothetical protein